MSKEIVQSEINVNDNKIKVIRIGSKEYISLTDLARYANLEEPKVPIQTWMRNKDGIAYLGLWKKLLKTVASKLSRKEKNAKIYATRMLGDFYTGACYIWNIDVPFIPVDAIVNVCGTAIYKLNKNISNEEFIAKPNSVLNNKKSYLDFANTYLLEEVLKTIDINDSSKYYWNYTSGNHFIIFAESDGEYGLEEGQYMIVHVSAIEFKKDNLEFVVYPVKGNWYYDDIKIEYDEESKRYLRYITGKKQKDFMI